MAALRQATGLAGLKRFIWTSGFDGKDWSDQVFIAAPGPRTGLLTLLDPAPISDAAFASIPNTATVAGVAKFDAAKFVETIRGIATDIDPNAGAQIDEGLKMIGEQLKMDIRRDFLQALGDEWAYYTDPGTGGRGRSGSSSSTTSATPTAPPARSACSRPSPTSSSPSR